MAIPSTPPGPPGFAPHPEHRRRGRDGGRVLVLNATYEPINVCTVRRAAVLLLKEKAEIVEHSADRAALRERDHAAAGRHPPRDLRQGPARHAPAQDHPARRLRPRRLDVPVLRRPCEPHRRSRHPALQGRLVDWENIVASCAPCNRRKGDHLPHKAEMHPRQMPRAPHPHVFIHVASPTIPPAWRQWLPKRPEAQAGPSRGCSARGRRRREVLGAPAGHREVLGAPGRPSRDARRAGRPSRGAPRRGRRRATTRGQRADLNDERRPEGRLSHHLTGLKARARSATTAGGTSPASSCGGGPVWIRWSKPAVPT